MVDVVVVNPECGDWEALYIDGKLYAEGHSLNTRDIFDCLADIFPNNYSQVEISDEQAEYGMPKSLKKLMKGMYKYID